jgi:radical SAM-linked protein
MPRLLFTKEGAAIWSSHLDLMRALMRSFRRAGIELKHSQGFTPHPELSVVMPLSVGVSSECELADFALDEGETVPPERIPALLNAVLPAGLRVLDCWDGGQKAGKLALLRSRLTLTYDGGVPAGTVEALTSLFARPSLTVEKHSKKGPVETDVAPMIREVRIEEADGSTVLIEVLGSAQNPTLNPLLLVTAIETHLPELKPDFSVCRRLATYDAEGRLFR